jgi:hypothetical protein
VVESFDAVSVDAADAVVSATVVVAVDAEVVATGAAACAVEPAVAVDALFDPGRPPAKAAPPADNAVPAIKDIHNRRILMTPLTITSLMIKLPGHNSNTSVNILTY